MSTLLKSAKKHQKKRDWTKAVQYYQQYFEENPEDIEDDVYVGYAKCLRVLGNTNHAEELLHSGRIKYPKSERILKELNNLYDVLGNWEKAKQISQDLIELNPLESNSYFRLGRSYSALNENEKAKESYLKGLECKHNMDLNKLIEKIQSSFTDYPSEVSTEYLFIAGKNNYGAFIHSYKDKKYFTKISQNIRGARREEVFYREICDEYPVLKEEVPAYINSQYIDNILYLTLEMVEDIPIDREQEQTVKVIRASQKITSISYDSIINKYPNPKYLFQLKNKPFFIVIFFTQIHRKKYNVKMFNLLYKVLKQNNYPESVIEVIEGLESLIMKHSLYSFIKPKNHYSLIHGDLIRQNLKLNKSDKSIKIFDWATFTTGPHFIDIARYLSESLIPFSEVKSIYLNNDDINGNLSIIEKIFFLYALILLYILRLKGKGTEKGMDKYITPALNDLEVLVAEFIETSFNKNVQLLSEEKEKSQNKIEQLKHEVKQLKKEVKRLEKRHNNIINSKSWKITAPLRKFSERRNKRNY